MPIPSEVTLLSNDAALRDELTFAAQALGEVQPRVSFVADSGELMQLVRSKPPQLVLVPFDEDHDQVGQVARELQTANPPIPVVGVFRPNGFGDNVSESAVLIESMRAGVKDFLRRPVSTTEFRTLLETIGHQGSAPEFRPTTFGKVVSFISNKGGVGKSTMSVNTAVGLAMRHPGRVLLIDASLQMGVAAALLNLRPPATLAEIALERDRLDETLLRQLATVHESGLHMLAAPNDAIAAMDVDDTLLARIITLARRTYDYVVIDTFPMFDQVVVAALDLSDRAFIVVENVVPTLLGAVGLLDVLKRIGFPQERQSIIVNRQQRIAGGLSLPEVAERFGRQIDFVLPFEKRVMVAANSGEPIAQQNARLSGFCRVLSQVIDSIEDEASGTPLLQSAPAASDSIADFDDQQLDSGQLDSQQLGSQQSDHGEDGTW
ncbi:MAG: AAA family ATPase [Fuerstiella sp.]